MTHDNKGQQQPTLLGLFNSLQIPTPAQHQAPTKKGVSQTGTLGMTQTMSSREIAELTGKDHKNVIRDIRAMLDELEKDGSDLSHQYREEKDARGYTSCFHLDRELTDCLLTGYSVSARRRVIKRWHELEAKVASPALPNELSKLEILKLAIESEEAKLKAEAERDEAIRTKALIGSRREATAMATAAKEVRARKRLEIELDRSIEWATIKKMQAIHGGNYSWHLLKKASEVRGIEIHKVQDENYPAGVNSYHSSVWMAVYQLPVSV